MTQGELFNIQVTYSDDFQISETINATLTTLIERLNDPLLSETNVIKWGCPVPSFGNISHSKVATLGLNPSNREFVDDFGNELDGSYRRFHTLKSLGLDCWSRTEDHHLKLILDSCRAYFSRNPYDRWFKRLDQLISGTNASYYNSSQAACHLDLIPYATSCKWMDLSQQQRSSLLEISGDTLAVLLRDSPVRLLILNGKSVVDQFQCLTNICLQKETMDSWMLPRRSRPGVKGIAYKGLVSEFSGIKLEREILVLGFNHNIQSSFGVTKQVTNAIQRWIGNVANEVNL